MPQSYDPKPKKVNIYHPIIINTNPKKKNTVPYILEGLKKKKIVFLAPINETIPIKKDI